MDQGSDALAAEDTGIDLGLVDSAVHAINACHRLAAGRSRRRLLQDAVNDLCTTLEDSIVAARKAARENAVSSSKRTNSRSSRKRRRVEDSESSDDEYDGNTSGRRRAPRLMKEPGTPLSLASVDDSSDYEEGDENAVQSDHSPSPSPRRTRSRTRRQPIPSSTPSHRPSRESLTKSNTPGTRRSTRLASVAAQAAIVEAGNVEEIEESSYSSEEDSDANGNSCSGTSVERPSESDESETEAIELPIVRPRPRVDIICLASDKASKTPVYDTDDEDTDAEQDKARRQARHQQIIDEKQDERISKLPPLPPTPPPPPERTPVVHPSAQIPNGMLAPAGVQHGHVLNRALLPQTVHGAIVPHSQPITSAHPAGPYAVTQTITRTVTAPMVHATPMARTQGIVPHPAGYSYAGRTQLAAGHVPVAISAAASYGYPAQRGAPAANRQPTPQAMMSVPQHVQVQALAQMHAQAQRQAALALQQKQVKAQQQARAHQEAFRQLQAARQAEEQQRRAEEARLCALQEQQRAGVLLQNQHVQGRTSQAQQLSQHVTQPTTHAVQPSPQPQQYQQSEASVEAQNTARLKELHERAQIFSARAHAARQAIVAINSEARKHKMNAVMARDKVELEKKKLAHLDQEYAKHRAAMINNVRGASLELTSCEQRHTAAQKEMEELHEKEITSTKEMYKIEHQIHLLRQEYSIQAVNAARTGTNNSGGNVGQAASSRGVNGRGLAISASEMLTTGARNRTETALRRIEADFQEKNTADISDLEKLLNKEDGMSTANGQRSKGMENGTNPASTVANLDSIHAIEKR